MSQEKVNRYKEDKKNRSKNIQKEKREKFLLKTAGVVAAVLIIGWIGYSGFTNVSGKKADSGKTYSVDTAAIDEYMTTMSSEAAAETE